MNFFPIKLKGDRIIWILIIMLALISVLSVYSSTYQQTLKEGNILGVIVRHICFLFVGFVIIYVLHQIPVSQYKKLAPIALIFAIFLLALVFVDSSAANARAPRWALGGRLQPSDIARVVMVIYLAKALSEGFKNKEEFIIKILLPVGIVCLMIINGHTSAVIMIGFASLLLILMSTSNRKYLTITFLCVAVAGILYFTFDEYLGRAETVEGRFGTFFGAKENKTDDLQAATAKLAIASGGIIGKGPGNSIYRETLSEAHNDYIYAIIVEEYGFVGGLFVMSIYMILFFRIILAIRKCNKIFPKLLLSGLILLIVVQAFIHIGVSVGGIPVTGQNLPFISKGGTSIITTSIAFGIILSVSRAIEESLEINDSEKV